MHVTSAAALLRAAMHSVSERAFAELSGRLKFLASCRVGFRSQQRQEAHSLVCSIPVTCLRALACWLTLFCAAQLFNPFLLRVEDTARLDEARSRRA